MKYYSSSLSCIYSTNALKLPAQACINKCVNTPALSAISQVKSLSSDKQLQLLEELAVLVRQKVTSENQHRRQEMPELIRDKWRGFVPKRVDDLDFQKSLR
ncbi:MAG: hypothetical protein F6K21_00625 [Symploca sp. SIO2D2]|nr:hypothetical protein [Symploca sp. SIO2D2]